MKINWNIQRAEGLTISSYAFAKVSNLVRGITETGTADFVVRHNTKSSLDIEISCSKEDGGRDNFAVAYIPKGGEKFKYLKSSHRNIFTGTVSERHHFKLTKTQGLPELQEYLTLVLRDFVPQAEGLDVNLVLYQLPEL